MEVCNIGSFLRKLKVALRFTFIMLIQVYTLPNYVLWTGVVFLPLRIFKPSLYWRLERIVYTLLIRFIGGWVWLVGYKIQELGDTLEPCFQQRCLVVANHQSTADVPMLMAALTFKDCGGVLSSTMWIISNIFRYTNFGLVSWIRGDFFIAQGKDVRETQLANLATHLRTSFLSSAKKWIVLFPEGGFLFKRRESSLKFARKNGHRLMYNVTLPRLGAVNQILETLSERNLKKDGLEDEAIKWIIDVTIAYSKDDPLHLTSSCTLKPTPPATTHIHYRRYPVHSVPTEDSDKFKEWLFDRWSEKEDMLEEFYKTGEFVPQPNIAASEEVFLGRDLHRTRQEGSTGDPLKNFNLFIILFLHFFYLMASYFNWMMIRSLWYYSGQSLFAQTSTLLAVPEH